jgi:hypothetical protein
MRNGVDIEDGRQEMRVDIKADADGVDVEANANGVDVGRCKMGLVARPM